MKIKTWSDEVVKRHKPKSIIGMPIIIKGRNCIIKDIHKDTVEVFEINKEPKRFIRYK